VIEGCPHAVGAQDQLLRDERVLAPRFGLFVSCLPIVAPVGVL
jgi:hypothetical protein